MDAYRHVVVTVPGVGDGESGDTLQALAAALPGPPGSYHRSDLVLGHETYPRLVNSAPSLPDLVELPREGGRASAPSWRRLLACLCRLVTGLPQVVFDWCDAAPSVRVLPAYRDVVAHGFPWTVWPVLLVLVHGVVAPSALPHAAVLDAAALGALALLARSQWRQGNRATPAGYAWLSLCGALTAVLWLAPRWTGLATALSIRLYGLGVLVGALLFVALSAETVARMWRDQIVWRRGLAGLVAAAVPLALTSLLTATLWTGVLNGVVLLGSAPQLEALKGWQQGFADGLGFPLATCEWAMAWATAIVGTVLLGVTLYATYTRRAHRARLWLLGVLVLVPVFVLVTCLCALLASRYVHAPLAGVVKGIGEGADPVAIYTWSLFRVAPWVLLLLTPARRVLGTWCEAGFYAMAPDAGGGSFRQGRQQRLAGLLEFLDRGRYDRIHVIAHGQASVVALDVIQRLSPRHSLVLTTLGSPAGPLFCDILDWPLDPAALVQADWRNLFREDDLEGGPTGVEGVDVVLPPGGPAGYWSDALVAERIVGVLRAPLPAPRE